ncbi:hypothetical protein HYX13_01610 [Candidatus Woesearchaeota archaeon]|nr:hypothetical protein [Candidatus Woesearchaeota archaeon]
MSFYHHQAKYNLGERELQPQERLVIGTRKNPQEPMRVAQHLGLSPSHPDALILHRVWDDGEYLATFQTKQHDRFSANYMLPDGTQRFGYGLEGKTVYLTHTLSREYTSQDLVTRLGQLAWTAKYNGADNVVLLAYTLNYGAQERGVHDTEHQRMQTLSAQEKFDGQAPTAQWHLLQLAQSGVDAIITPHTHSPEDMQRICKEVNEELLPLHELAKTKNHTLRYHVKYHNIDLSPVIGTLFADIGETKLSLDTSNQGKNILFVAVDNGITPFVRNCRQYSGLVNSAFAAMHKKRAKDGVDIDCLELVDAENLDPKRGIEGMQVVVLDDMIRSGSTMDMNIRVLGGQDIDGIKRSDLIFGKPERVIVYATRTICNSQAIDILSKNKMVKDVLVTNADSRVKYNLGQLATKTQILWINFVMGAAAKAVEHGEDPNMVLTPAYIRKHQLLHLQRPHEHYRNTGEAEGII